MNSNNQLYNKREFIEKYTSGKIKLVGIYGLLRTKSLKKIKGVKNYLFHFHRIVNLGSL